MHFIHLIFNLFNASFSFAISSHVYYAEKCIPCYDYLSYCLPGCRLEQEDHSQKGEIARQCKKWGVACRNWVDEMKCSSEFMSWYFLITISPCFMYYSSQRISLKIVCSVLLERNKYYLVHISGIFLPDTKFYQVTLFSDLPCVSYYYKFEIWSVKHPKGSGG